MAESRGVCARPIQKTILSCNAQETAALSSRTSEGKPSIFTPRPWRRSRSLSFAAVSAPTR